MTKKQLNEKAIDIHGKSYVLVSDRVLHFNEIYPSGCIKTKLISPPDSQMVVIKAQVTPDIQKPIRYFTGYSQAKWGEGMVNKTAALENAETSAVGRALGMMGIGVIDSIASADEVNKAVQSTKEYPATEKQRKMIFALIKQKGIDPEETKESIKTFYKLDSFNNLTITQAKKVIDGLLKKPDIPERDIYE